ncbi:MAG TPA: hypothetical protein VMW91_12310 [Desulfosporosinus sp.]|nr:hypothetical protein [Desulfosporosinus sp.]
MNCPYGVSFTCENAGTFKRAIGLILQYKEINYKPRRKLLRMSDFTRQALPSM